MDDRRLAADNQPPATNRTQLLDLFGAKERVTIAVAALATVGTLALKAVGADSVIVFILSAVALASLASLVGDGTDQVGNRLGSGATGVLQSALGNLPELFISIF